MNMKDLGFKFFLLTFVVFSNFTYAGATMPKPKKIYVNKVTNADALYHEWSDNKIEFEAFYDDMGMEIKIAKFMDSFYYDNDSSKIIKIKKTGLFIKQSKSHEHFSLGDKLQVQVRFFDKAKNKFVTYQMCYKDYNFGGGVPKKKCRDDVYATKTWALKRDAKTGALRHRNDKDGDALDYEYREDENFEYFEVFVSSDYLKHYQVKSQNAVPFIVVTAKNNKQSGNIVPQSARHVEKLSNASSIWNDYAPSAKDYLRDIPDVRPVVQVGVSAEFGRTNGNLSLTTDFRGLSISVEPGVSLNNSDFEIEAFGNGYFSDYDNVVSGQTTTVSGDIGGVGFGGSMIYDSNNNLIGGGITFGFSGLPDADISINYGETLINTKGNDSSGSRSGSNRGSRGSNRTDGYDKRNGRTSRVNGEGGHSIEN